MCFFGFLWNSLCHEWLYLYTTCTHANSIYAQRRWDGGYTGGQERLSLEGNWGVFWEADNVLLCSVCENSSSCLCIIMYTFLHVCQTKVKAKQIKSTLSLFILSFLSLKWYFEMLFPKCETGPRLNTAILQHWNQQS